MATLMVPSVPFLKPTGQERPEASSRCTWDSVVRAPMAPQLPAHCGARLLEVDPHHDFQLALELVAQGLEAFAVFQGGDRIVDGAGTYHHQQALIVTGQDVVDGLTGFKDGI